MSKDYMAPEVLDGPDPVEEARERVNRAQFPDDAAGFLQDLVDALDQRLAEESARADANAAAVDHAEEYIARANGVPPTRPGARTGELPEVLT